LVRALRDALATTDDYNFAGRDGSRLVEDIRTVAQLHWFDTNVPIPSHAQVGFVAGSRNWVFHSRTSPSRTVIDPL
jgi:hypothetical protein